MNDKYKNELVTLDRVSKNYGHVKALRGVSFAIEAGSFVSIFGPNGAGKSTLLKILSHQTYPTGGEVLYSGVPLKKLDDSFRKKFGVISHQPFVYENLSALENLSFYASLYGVSDAQERACYLLKKVDLYSRRNDPVRTYSRGMLQRVSIARALVHDPEIIFLDEPYTGLDSVASKNLTDLLAEQISGNKTIVMVTHDLKIGLELATRAIIIKKGEAVFNEKKENIDCGRFEKIYLEHAGGEVAA